MLARGSRRWRVPADEIAELAAELRTRGVRYGTGRDMLSHRIAHVILSKMEAAGETCDDRTHESVRRTRQVQAAVAQVWPKADPVRLVFRLLSDPELHAAAPPTAYSTRPSRPRSRGQRPPRAPGSARWSAADAVLIDEAADLIERTPSMAHIVVDEAQDLSPMQCRAIGRRCATGSATVLGDIAQGTTPWATSSWQQMLGHLGKPEADLRVLDTGYRVPRQILDFASRLLSHIAPGLTPGVVGAPGSRRAADPASSVRPRSAARSRQRARMRSAGRARPLSSPPTSRYRRWRRSLGRGRGAARDPRGCGYRRGHHPGAGDAGQGPGVRPGHRLRAGANRDGGDARPAPALRRPDQGGLPADGAARRAAAARAQRSGTGEQAQASRHRASEAQASEAQGEQGRGDLVLSQAAQAAATSPSAPRSSARLSSQTTARSRCRWLKKTLYRSISSTFSTHSALVRSSR